MKYGLQMYSVRDLTSTDMEGALKRVAEMGYRCVEFAGFFNHEAEQIKAWLDRYGLVCTGTHSGVEGLAPDQIEASIAYHKAIGCENYIIPGADLSKKAKLEAFIALIPKHSRSLRRKEFACIITTIRTRFSERRRDMRA